MKLIGYVIAIILIVVIILPVLIIRGCDITQEEKKMLDLPKGEDIEISVLNHRNNEVMNLTLEEYIVGVVAAEMPVTFELEALKAQAIAARTYTIRRMQQFGAQPNEKHPEQDVCTDYAHCQAWISKEDRLKAWREDKNLGILDHVSLWNKLIEAISSTTGQIITYNGQPIDPLFHSTSGGKTENSEDYFSTKLPYLRSVISEYEDRSPHMVTKVKMTIDEFVTKLEEKIPDIKIDKKNIEKEIEIIDKTEGGKIASIRIGNKTLLGREAREALGLKSSDFTIETKGKEMTFTVIGYGHGVGLSQYGADGMAKQGSDYKKIIKHYYQGVEIVNINEM